MLNPDLIKLDALEFLWRSIQTSPDFEASRADFSRAFGALVLSELTDHLAKRRETQDMRAYAKAA